MVYLKRDERRSEVLDAMIRTAGLHGFDGASVRRVCSDMGISPGNIHHLFGSVAEMKREAFRLFASYEIARLDAAAEQPSLEQQLHSYLSSVAIGIDEAARRIWNSASQEATRDSEFAQVWYEETDVWRQRISELLVRLSGREDAVDAAEKAAWRLIWMSIGVTFYAGNGRYGIDEADVTQHLTSMISQELSCLTYGRVPVA